jgi:hypothetical protein
LDDFARELRVDVKHLTVVGKVAAMDWMQLHFPLLDRFISRKPQENKPHDIYGDI